ncbi:formate dehydrogenase accessory sulfurtransferase FdhD [Sphingobium sp. CCH11-B1]|jgi:FdhD protein|uniref:formate dehydrogenase accessory sulfurtransferase FdhD n=1 Tax=Sphingobium sp. CCH11-B1 TaxID=1768781 RepID=UPI00083356E6|nr:formate dehydrogenase accessory sulfurtransferase FdhD [Sphingobium sp. CCH11-B1]MEA3391242.1 formate dehydrogenase accessory sulfurtransferase FdhD [Pseudomonadota bacterium]
MHKPDDAFALLRLDRLTPDGGVEPVDRQVAEERPIAIEFNGVGYAVLMATPTDLADLVNGFALSERLTGPTNPFLDVDLHSVAGGVVARATLPPDRAAALLERVRHRATDSSCGLCGIENLEQAMRPLPRVNNRSRADRAAIFRALSRLHDHQPLGRATGAAHAAALVDARGAIRLVREDVGRHNAFDKLIGAMRAADMEWDGGFALLSSRCSYELVEKAALADCPMLVTISAPTRLAVERAEQAALPLVALARPDAMLGRGAAPHRGAWL